MIVLDSQCRARTPGVLAWCLCCVLLTPHLLADGDAAQHTQPTGRWRDATREEYREHVSALAILTQACAKSRDLKTCDPTLVGPDDRVTLSPGAEPRLERYGWLRVLFSHAEEPDKADAAPDSQKTATSPGEMTLPPPSTTSQLLDEARVRLAHDLAQANSGTHPPPAYADERAAMQQVLAGREFRGLEQPSEEDSALERFGNWLNRVFASVGKLRAHSAWIGRALVCGFIAIVGVALAWGLMQLERRWRVRLVPAAGRSPADTPSARDWQLWLNDAHRAAADRQWRDAIHFLYWAAISRLESRRLWPSDCARTPREYLALMTSEDPRQAGLASLTGSFERTWYGGRKADEADYRRAESLAGALIFGNMAAELPAAKGEAQ